MSGCGRNDRTGAYNRQLYLRNNNSVDCEDKDLKIPGCILKRELKNNSEVFGPVSENERALISQKIFFLKFQGQDTFRLYTRRSHHRTGQVIIRYLNIVKIDPKEPLIKDVSPTSTDSTFRNIQYFIEIWHKDSDGDLMHYPNRSQQPQLRRKIEDLYGDPLQLPKLLGSEFYFKILAIGKPLKQRKIRPNFRIEVESRGYYPLAISLQENALQNTSIQPGTVKVLANGKAS